MTDHPNRSPVPADANPSPDAFPPLPICWPALTPQEQLDQLEALDDWTRWLTARYTLDHRTVPPCWAQHGALLEELSALRTAWLTAYSLTSRGDAPLEWHVHFAAARRHLTDWTARSGCRPGEHRGLAHETSCGPQPALEQHPLR